MKLIFVVLAIGFSVGIGCTKREPRHVPPVDSKKVDVIDVILKRQLFIGTKQNYLPSNHQYWLEGSNGFLKFSYRDDFEQSNRTGKWQDKALNYSFESRTVDWQLYDTHLNVMTNGFTKVSYAGWEPDSGIPFAHIQKIISIQPFVQVGEFSLWNEVGQDYTWVTFCSRGGSFSIAILPDNGPVTATTLQQLTYYDIVH